MRLARPWTNHRIDELHQRLTYYEKYLTLRWGSDKQRLQMKARALAISDEISKIEDELWQQ